MIRPNCTPDASMKTKLGILHRAVLTVLLSFAFSANDSWAASPTMSTAPGSAGVCGGPGDLCEPTADVFANYPLPT